MDVLDRGEVLSTAVVALGDGRVALVERHELVNGVVDEVVFAVPLD